MTLDYSKFFDVMDSAPKPMFAGDEALNVRFFKKVCEDASRYLDNGRPLSYLADFIEIRIPNDAGIPNIVCRGVTPSDKIRFSRQWKIYHTQENKDESNKQLIGFPINEWAFIDKKRCDMLQNMGFDTVEQIAGMSENNALAITGSLGINGLVLKEKANAFLAQRKVYEQITTEVKKSLKEDEQSDNQLPSKSNRYSKPIIK